MSRTVLRGERESNLPDLLDYLQKECFNLKKFGLVLLMLVVGIYLYTGTTNKINIDLASKVEESRYRTGGPIKISENFDGYFLMNDYDGSKVPILLSLSFDYHDVENGKISDSINNIEIEFIGTDREFQIEKSENNKYDYTLFFKSKSDTEGAIKLTNPKSSEHEIAYLKQEFKDDIEIKKINNDQISYIINKKLDFSHGFISFRKNSEKDEIIMRVKNYGRVISRE